MSHPLTDDPTSFPAQVTSPDNGDPDIAESVEVGLQALADRTAHLHDGNTTFAGTKLFTGPFNHFVQNLTVQGEGFGGPLGPPASGHFLLAQAARLMIEDGNLLPDSDAQIVVDATNIDPAGIIRYVAAISANRKYWLATSAVTHPRGTIVVIVHGDEATNDATIGYSSDGGTTVTNVVVLPASQWSMCALHRAGVGSSPDRWRLLFACGAAVPQAGA